jgi:hypothetical protein
MQQKMDKKRVELLEVEGVANVIEEKVQVLAIYIQRRITPIDIKQHSSPVLFTTSKYPSYKLIYFHHDIADNFLA